MSDGRRGWARRAILCLLLLAVVLSAITVTRTASAGADLYGGFFVGWTTEIPDDGDDVPGVRLHDGCCMHHTQLPPPAVHRVAAPVKSSVLRMWRPQSADRSAPPSPLARPPRA